MADQSNRPNPDMPAVRAAWQRPVNFFLPTVYRCMAEPYVDAFLQRGQLRLSSFSAFRKHKDEQRGDTEEAQGMWVGLDSERQRRFSVFGTMGTQAYVLSTMLYPVPDLRAELGGGCFEIADVDQFACQIGNELAGCIGIDIGFCLYEEVRITHLGGMNLPPDRFQDDKDPTKNSMDKILAAAAEVQGPRQMFQKHPRYRPQCEYRFIWHINRPTSEFIDIALPSVPPYCRKIT